MRELKGLQSQEMSCDLKPVTLLGVFVCEVTNHFACHIHHNTLPLLFVFICFGFESSSSSTGIVDCKFSVMCP